MATNGLDEYWVPEHVKDYLRKLGFVLPLDDMEPWIRSWDDWMSARGDFYDYRDKDGMGRVQYDDSIIQDVAAEKAQDMREMGVTLNAWEYRMKWLGEDEETARRHAAEIGASEDSAK